MKLTDLDPKWIIRDGLRIGFTFLSPAQSAGMGPIRWRQSCFTIAICNTALGLLEDSQELITRLLGYLNGNIE